MRIRAGELFGQGRLLAGKELSDTFRELYHCECKIWDAHMKLGDKGQFDTERGLLIHKVELLMKKELEV